MVDGPFQAGQLDGSQFLLRLECGQEASVHVISFRRFPLSHPARKFNPDASGKRRRTVPLRSKKTFCSAERWCIIRNEDRGQSMSLMARK
jgi:hypothetical protein